jgi:arabinofuranosyltransferase
MTERKVPVILLILLLTAFAARIYLFLSIGYTADDALITIRYAENLAGGKGFVYNEGEKVLGTTTPLLTLLLAGFLKLKINGILASFLLNQLADLCTAFFLYQIFRYASRPFSLLPSFLFLFNPENLQWSLSGMETEFSIFLIFSSIYFSSRNGWNLAFLAAALAVWTRVDSVAVPVALTAVYVFRFKKLPLIPLAILTVVLLPWIAFASIYFGSPIPNSAIAKASLAGNNYIIAFRDILGRGFLHIHSFGIPFLILAFLGTWVICREKRELLILPVWTWGYALSYTLAAGGMHPWYYAPFYVGYLALVFAGFLYVVEKAPFLKPVWVARAICSIAIVIVLYISYLRLDRLREMQAHLNTMNKAVGLWVKENSPVGTVLAIKDIGYMGYYSQRKVLDLAGLVSPQSIPYRAKGDFLGPIQKFLPDYFAFSAGQIRNLRLRESDLLQNYEIARTIQNQFGSYTIFKLKKTHNKKEIEHGGSEG